MKESHNDDADADADYDRDDSVMKKRIQCFMLECWRRGAEGIGQRGGRGEAEKPSFEDDMVDTCLVNRGLGPLLFKLPKIKCWTSSRPLSPS